MKILGRMRPCHNFNDAVVVATGEAHLRQLHFFFKTSGSTRLDTADSLKIGSEKLLKLAVRPPSRILSRGSTRLVTANSLQNGSEKLLKLAVRPPSRILSREHLQPFNGLR